MIRNLEINFFQSHRNSILEFHEGVNLINGDSDSGKSALFKAFTWLTDNRPLGDDFKSWFSESKDTINVGMEFIEGTYVLKERKGTKNTYDLNGTLFEALKSDVPEELKKLTNLADYNIQQQHQSYFLLQDTPGEVARKFNEWVGLDIIDKAFSKINSIVAIAKGKITDYDNEITSLAEKIEKLSYLDEIQALLEELDTLHSKKEIIENRTLLVNRTVQSIEALQGEIDTLIFDEDLEKETKAILALTVDYKKKRNDLLFLDKLISSIEKTKREIQEESDWLLVEESYKEVNALLIAFASSNKKIKALSATIINIDSTNKLIDAEELNYENLLTKKKDLLSQVTICPTCQLPVTPKSRKCIEEGI